MKNFKKVLLVVLCFSMFVGLTQLNAKVYKLSYDNLKQTKNDNNTFEGSINLDNTNNMYFYATENNDLTKLINDYNVDKYLLTVNDKEYDLINYNAKNINLKLEDTTTVEVSIHSDQNLKADQKYNLLNDQFQIRKSIINFNNVKMINNDSYAKTPNAIVYSKEENRLQEVNLISGDVINKPEINKNLVNHRSDLDAIGYKYNSENKNNFVYGIDKNNKQLVEISSTNVNFYDVNGLNENMNITAGEFDPISNSLVLTYTLDGFNNLLYGYIPLSSDDYKFFEVTSEDNVFVSLNDIYYDKNTDDFYGVEANDGTIIKANIKRDDLNNIANTTVEKIDVNTGVKNVAGIFGYNGEEVYLYDLNGKVYLYDFNLNKTMFITNAPKNIVDGTFNASDVKVDLGDAEDTFATTIDNDGPKHAIIDEDTYLGNGVSADNDVLKTDFVSDKYDDGITDLTLINGANNELQVKASIDGYVSIWVDLNNDNEFNNKDEKVIEAQPVVAGNNTVDLKTLTFEDSVEKAALRIRYVRAQNQQEALNYIATPTGSAPNGEVEDYLLNVENNDRLNIVKNVTENQPYGNGNDKAEVGEMLHYEIKITNTSDKTTSKNIKVTEQLPLELDSQTVNNVEIVDEDNNTLINPINGVKYEVVDNNINIFINEIKPNETVYVKYDVSLRSDLATTTTVKNITNVKDDKKEYKNILSTIEMSKDNDFVLTQTNVDNEDNKAQVNETLNYEVKIINNDKTSKEDVDVKINEEFSDLKDINLMNVNSNIRSLTKDDYNLSNNKLTLNKVNANETITIKYSGKVKESLENTNAKTINNQSVVCLENECANTNITKVAIKYDFKIDQKTNVNNVNAGNTITYNASLTNKSNVNLNNVVIENLNIDENVNNNVKLLNVSTEDQNYEVNNNKLEIKTLKPNETITIEYTSNIKSPLVNSQEQIIKSQLRACVGNDCTNSNKTVTNFETDFEIIKENVNNEDDLAQAGETIQYKVTLKNNSDIELKEITVKNITNDENIKNKFTVESITDMNNKMVVPKSNTNDGIVFENMPAGETYNLILNTKVYKKLNDKDATSISNEFEACINENKTCKKTAKNDVKFSKSFDVSKSNVNNPDGYAQAGEKLFYDIRVTNTSDINISDVTVNDPVSDNNLSSGTLNLIEVRDSTGNLLQEGVDYKITGSGVTLFDIPSGEYVTIRISVRVKYNLPDDSALNISNTAQACTDECWYSNEVLVPFDSGYFIKKENINNPDGYATQGETLQYRVSVINNSDAPIRNVVVKDKMQDQNLDNNTIELISVTDQNNNVVSPIRYVINGKSIKFFSIPANTTYHITFSVKVSSPLVHDDATDVSNVAEACQSEDCITSNKVDVPFISGYSIKKENVNNPDNIAQNGETLYYDITLTNNGSSDLKNVTVNDAFSDFNFDKSSVEVISVTNKNGNTVPPFLYSVSDKKILIKNLPAGQEYTIHIAVDVDEDLDNPFANNIKNTAEVCYEGACDDSNQVVVPLNPDVSITKNNINNEDGYASNGEKLYYEIEVTNETGGTLNNVKIRDHFNDSNFDLGSIKVENVLDENGLEASNNEYDVQTNPDQVVINSINPGDSYTIIVSVDVLDVLTNTNVDNITNIATACTTACITTPEVNVPFAKDFSISKENINNEDQYAEAGEKLYYEITVTNNSDVALNNVVVKDPFNDPNFNIARIELESIKDENGNDVKNYTFDSLDGSIMFNMKPNTSYSIVLSVDVLNKLPAEDNDLIKNTAQICYGHDCKDSNEVDVPFKKDFVIRKENVNNEDGIASPGETLYYEISLQNLTSSPIKNIAIQDLFGDEAFDLSTIKLISITNEHGIDILDYTIQGQNKIVFDRLPGNTTFTCLISIEVKDSVDISNDTIDNTANAIFGDAISNSNEVSIPTETIFSIDKENVKNDDNQVSSSEYLYYDITIKNLSMSAKENVKITDPFNDKNFDEDTVELINITSNGKVINNYSFDGKTVIIDKILPNQEMTVHFKVKANDNLNGDQIENTATVCYDNYCADDVESTNIKKSHKITDPNDNFIDKLTNTGTIRSIILLVILILSTVLVFRVVLRNKRS